MKRVLSGLLTAVFVLVFVCSFTSCTEMTAYELVSNAVAKTEKLDSYEMKFSMHMSVNTAGITMEIPANYDIKAAGVHTENPVMSGKITTSVMGQEMSADVYNDGKYAYVDMMDQKMKLSLEDEGSDDYDLASATDGLVEKLPEDALKDVQIVKNEDGSKTVSVTLSKEIFESVYGDLSAEVADESSEFAEGMEFSFSDMVVNITVLKNGYIGTYELSFKMTCTMSVEEESYDMVSTVSVKAEYVNPGADVTVTAPNLEEYTEPSLM